MDKVEKNFSYMQKDTTTLMGVLKELQRFFIGLAAEHRGIKQRIEGWPFIKVHPKE